MTQRYSETRGMHSNTRWVHQQCVYSQSKADIEPLVASMLPPNPSKSKGWVLVYAKYSGNGRFRMCLILDIP